MAKTLAVLKSRKAVISLWCIAGTLALAAGLFGTGVLDTRQATLLIFAMYIGSKVFMVGIVIWAAVGHSPRFRNFLQRHVLSRATTIGRSLRPRQDNATSPSTKKVTQSDILSWCD